MDRRDWLRSAGLVGAGLMIDPIKLLQFDAAKELTRDDFGPAFEWGVATAAYQIEGAHQADGKGPSVWDVFSHTKKKIMNGDHGDVACDFYHRYESDLAIMASMNIPNYRFSTSWSRILPEGTGKVNQKGLDFYHRVIDTCLEKGMQPWITLYHWDLPQALEEKGGWTNRDVLGWFSEYANIVTKEYGDKVKKWMILNEPMAFVGLGYMLGMHAPGRKGIGNFFPAIHHASLVQGEGSRLIRANVPDAEIGSTFSCAHIMPVKQKEKHIKAAARVDALFNRLFLEPALGLGYPTDTFKPLSRIEKYFKEGDEKRLIADLDFWGLQNYTREVVKKHFFPPFLWAKMIPPEKRGVEQEMRTEMNWEVYPEGIYHLLKKFAAYEGIDRILVTENGAAFPDKVEGGAVHDPRRTRFLQKYLEQIYRAKKEGVNVQGYFVWTFMDNFEWAEGYHPRFGLVHVDFENQKRTIKDSGLWFKSFLQGDK